MNMALPNLIKLIYRNLRVNTDGGTLMILVGMPALYLIFFGFGFGSLIPAKLGASSYLTQLAPGVMAFQTVIAGTVAGSMLWADRRWGMLAQLLVGPFTRTEYLMGIMLTSVVFGLAGALVMMGIAHLMGAGFVFSGLGLVLMFGSIVMGSILFGSMMLFISAMVKSMNAYNSIQILLLFIVNFASTVFYPMSPTLPLPIQVLFEVNPLTYLANATRDGYLGTFGMADAYAMVLIAVVMMVMLGMAVWAYMRSHVSFV